MPKMVRKNAVSKRFICKGVLVDLFGIEPMTSSMPWKRAPSCATGPLFGRDLSIVADAERQVKQSSTFREQMDSAQCLRAVE
jgi:hypothetical protein